MSKDLIKVLIIDDSAFIRVLLSQILDNDPGIIVVATARDPYDARAKIKKHQPDVLTLDIEMPKMDGLTFLNNLMRLRPMPVIMVSNLTQVGADATIRSLKLGAFDFVAKPRVDVKDNLMQLSSELIQKVKSAAKCNTFALEKIPYPKKENLKLKVDSKKVDVIAIGGSTGGTEAIQSVLARLPHNLPPIVITQHIPDVFSTSYAKRLNSEVVMQVSEVRTSQKLIYGNAYLAPGHLHMKVMNKNNSLWCDLSDEAPVNRHRPSVEVLFDSVTESVGKRSIGVLLTGMGQDGAAGLLRLKESGALTIAQDEESSVVWGMPGAAVKIGAAVEILSLEKIPEYLISRL